MQPNFDGFSLFFFSFYFQPDLPQLLLLPFSSWCLSFAMTLLFQRSKPRHLTAASLPVPPLLWYLPLAALQPQLARNHDTALFVQQLLLLFVWLSPGTLGSTYIVAQPGNSCGDW